jgi:plastocyanin
MRRGLLLAALALAMPAMAGGAQLTPLRVGSLGVGVHTIDIAGFDYSPRVDVVGTGTTVAWTNHDEASHTATQLYGAWDTGNVPFGETRTVSFHQVGAWFYKCQYHPMYGWLIVAAELPQDA